MQSSGLKIVVVDDEEMILKLLEMYIKKMGHIPILFNKASSAHHFLENGEYDIVLTDYCMPDTNGEKNAKIAKQARAGVPVILISGTPLTRPKGELFDQVLRKPFTLPELKDAIESLGV